MPRDKRRDINPTPVKRLLPALHLVKNELALTKSMLLWYYFFHFLKYLSSVYVRFSLFVYSLQHHPWSFVADFCGRWGNVESMVYMLWDHTWLRLFLKALKEGAVSTRLHRSIVLESATLISSFLHYCQYTCIISLCSGKSNKMKKWKLWGWRSDVLLLSTEVSFCTLVRVTFGNRIRISKENLSAHWQSSYCVNTSIPPSCRLWLFCSTSEGGSVTLISPHFADLQLLWHEFRGTALNTC